MIDTGTDKGNDMIKAGSEGNSGSDDNAVKANDDDDKITEESVEDEQSNSND